MRFVLFVSLALLFCGGLTAQPAPNYSFSENPFPLMTSYYDYLIGGYSGLPLQTIPSSAGGGYFASYQAKADISGLRRVYHNCLSSTGMVLSLGPISDMRVNEGFVNMAVDPVSGKALYVWHADADTDGELEVMFTSDAFITGISGLFNTPQVIIDNPISITAPNGTIITNNTFVWPTVTIGPSPVANKRRVYVLARNAYTASDGHQTQNAYIAYADFDAFDIENGVPLVFSYLSVPQLCAWDVDPVVHRYPVYNLVCDGSGNVYVCGYHQAFDANEQEVNEPRMDIFKVSNFGQGDWTYYGGNDLLPSWNPPEAPGSATGYFKSDQNQPYSDAQIFWRIINYSNVNCVIDYMGRIHVPAYWGLMNSDGDYYPDLQVMKKYMFDPASGQFTIHEIYPQKDVCDIHNVCYQPWDLQDPFGETDGWTQINGAWQPNMQTFWNFGIWGSEEDYDLPYTYYHNLKLTTSSGGWMAALWQSSWKARQYRVNGNEAYSAWNDSPELMLSISPCSGFIWSEPISLNSVETPQFNYLIPMWANPAGEMIYTGDVGGNQMHKLGLLFYDDYSWYCNSLSSAPVTNPGGRVMFTELQFNLPISTEDPGLAPAAELIKSIYPNPFREQLNVEIELPKTTELKLEIYNLKGQLFAKFYQGVANSGQLRLSWDGKNSQGNLCSSGIYFCKLSANGKSEIRKLLRLR